jgi:D-psicose/D-tagatose/L-ribulose 3-epimerase
MIMLKTGMNLLLWTTHVTEQHDAILDQIKAIGFDAVEVPIFDTADLAPFERLGKRIKGLGLGATAVTVMGAETNPISPDAKVRDAAVAHLDRVMECGQAFGCEILCGPIHSAIGVFSNEAPTEDEFKHGVDTLRRAAEKAQARDVRMAVEYLNRFEIYFLTTAAQAARLVRAVDHPHCKMMYDSFHAHIEEKDQESAIASCAAETIHVHVSENDRGIPGTGQVHWDQFFRGLEQTGYRGYLTIEAFGRALPALAAATRVWRDLFPDPMGLCRDGLAFIKSRVQST